jgi:hypothetical protein
MDRIGPLQARDRLIAYDSLRGERAVATDADVAELADLVARGRVQQPALAKTITVTRDVSDPVLSSELESRLVKVKGKQVDAVIGATVIRGGYAFVADDAELGDLLRQYGVDVRFASGGFDEDS